MFFGGVASSLATLKNSSHGFTTPLLCCHVPADFAGCLANYLQFSSPTVEKPSNRHSPQRSMENKCTLSIYDANVLCLKILLTLTFKWPLHGETRVFIISPLKILEQPIPGRALGVVTKKKKKHLKNP